MYILLAGFMGNNNSAKILLDKISPNSFLEKLYLENDFSVCKEQLEQKLNEMKYHYIIAIGQKPVIKSIYIETAGRGENEEYYTKYDYEALAEFLKSNGFKVKTSDNAGNYLCNHVYFNGLRYINTKSMDSQMIFIHVPYLKNIEDINRMGHVFAQYIDSLENNTIM